MKAYLVCKKDSGNLEWGQRTRKSAILINSGVTDLISSDIRLFLWVYKRDRWLTETFDGGPSGELSKYKVWLFAFKYLSRMRYEK
jgi:hypothetical protein